VEPACSNIAVQRTVDDYTSYMTRVRAKFKINGEIFKHWSASKRERLYDSYTIPKREGLQGTDRAVTTCRLPLNRGIPSYPQIPCTRAPCPCTKKLPIPPRVPDPTDWQIKDIDKPEETTNRHLNLTLLLLILVIWMFKHEVKHVKIMTSKLYASSYITIITWRQLYSSLYALLYEWYENLNLKELFIVFITKVALSSKETSSPCSSW
jgi:hypothetical protein